MLSVLRTRPPRPPALRLPAAAAAGLPAPLYVSTRRPVSAHSVSLSPPRTPARPAAPASQSA